MQRVCERERDAEGRSEHEGREGTVCVCRERERAMQRATLSTRAASYEPPRTPLPPGTHPSRE
eukprot:1334672-Pyramimonas_sp.AAC.1